MRSKIILILVISSLIIGCIDTTKISSIQKGQPCVQQTSTDGRSTISQGDCNKSQLYGLSPDEQKLIGTWSIKSEFFEGSYTFNSDRTGKGSSPTVGNRYFNWRINNGILYSDTNEFSPPISGGSNYRLVNNDKTLVLHTIMGEVYLEKSWW